MNLFQVLSHRIDRGKATVVELAHRGAKVYIGSRTESKVQESIEQIKQQIPEADVHFLKLDLTSFESVREAVESFKRFLESILKITKTLIC